MPGVIFYSALQLLICVEQTQAFQTAYATLEKVSGAAQSTGVPSAPALAPATLPQPVEKAPVPGVQQLSMSGNAPHPRPHTAWSVVRPHCVDG